MANEAVAQLIARTLFDGPVHPGDGKSGPVALPLGMFRAAAGLPEDQAMKYAEEAGLPHPDIAKLTAEALVARMETDYVFMPRAEAEQLRRTPPEQAKHRQVDFYSSCNAHTRLFSGAVTDLDTGRATISCQVIKALQQLSPECAVMHRPEAS